MGFSKNTSHLWTVLVVYDKILLPYTLTVDLSIFQGGNWPATIALSLVDFLTWKGCVDANGICTTTAEVGFVIKS